MSLTAAIVDRFDFGDDPTINDLTALVSHCWVDEIPTHDEYGDELHPPYLAVSEVSETVVADGKDYSWRFEEAVIQFSAFADTKYECEQILEAVENAHQDIVFDLSDVTQAGRPLVINRVGPFKDDLENIWQGVLDFRYPLNAQL